MRESRPAAAPWRRQWLGIVHRAGERADVFVAVGATTIALSAVCAAIALSTGSTPVTRVAPGTAGSRPAAAGQAGPERVTCVIALRAGAYAVEGSVKAARARLRPRTMTTQGTTYRLTPGNYEILRVAPVSVHAAKGTEERRSARRCRAGVSRASSGSRRRWAA